MDTFGTFFRGGLSRWPLPESEPAMPKLPVPGGVAGFQFAQVF